MRRVIQILVSVILIALVVFVERGLAGDGRHSLHVSAHAAVTAALPLLLALIGLIWIWRGEIGRDSLESQHDDEMRYWRPGWIRLPPTDPRDPD